VTNQLNESMVKGELGDDFRRWSVLPGRRTAGTGRRIGAHRRSREARHAAV